jgi:polysaccharide deacetylase family protein (PEP-CTERM system associated)
MSGIRLTPLRVPGQAPRVLTIDVEDWFHVCGDDFYSDPRRWEGFERRIEHTLPALLDRLDAGGHRATFFFLGWVAARHPALVAETARRGHEVAVHGNLHRRADELSPEDFRDDLRRARASVEDAAGASATSHRAAEWSVRRPTDAAVAVLAEEGFECDASMMPVPPLGPSGNPVGPYRIERNGWGLIEVPPLTGRALGRRLPVGGGWPFRLVSEAALARAERSFRSAGRPAVFTFHPWEFDAHHPPMEGLAPLTRTVHFLKLRALPRRFDRWLARDRCVPLRDAVARLIAA